MEKFIQLLKDVQIEGLFNPFTDVCPHHDKPDAPEIRTRNLREYLKVADIANSCVLGEAGGYNGYRRTGIAFTDNLTLDLLSETFKIGKLHVATKSGNDKERSATFVWRIIPKLENPPFIWNMNPMHPFDPKKGQLSNKKPSAKQQEAVHEAMMYFFDRFQFKNIYAIGQYAKEKMLKLYNREVAYIRHPSYGGQTEFTETMYDTFKIIV